MSEKPDDKERLNHIIESIDRIKKFTDGMGYDEFAGNEMAQFAVIKNFEIIGEAAYHLTDELKGKHLEIEWEKIQAFRHILVHDYYRINLEIVWKSKENKIDNLRRTITEILKET
jgi:uncharacterized protein with HEPN domain